MFSGGRRKSSSSRAQHEDEEECHRLTTSLMSAAAAHPTSPKHGQVNAIDKSQLKKIAISNSIASKQRKAKLAREESIGDDDYQKPATCARMAINLLKLKRIFIPLIIFLCMAAIYCVPYVEIEARITKSLPHIPFNFQEGPLQASTASQFKIEHLFRDQLRGAESVAVDSSGNLYMAIEGGFILYAHLNKSSPLKRSYYNSSAGTSARYTMLPGASVTHLRQPLGDYPDLVKIAELNGIRNLAYNSMAPPQQGRRARLAEQLLADHSQSRRQTRTSGASSWRRECQLDEKVYGTHLHSGGLASAPIGSNEIDAGAESDKSAKFVSNVHMSRCSKPLGIRLSQDESFLYVVDTLAGLYRVSLKVAERPYSTQRLVTRLVDFRNNRNQLLPVVQLDLESDNQQARQTRQSAIVEQPAEQVATARGRAYLNVSLMAVDDLVVDYGAGTRGADMIYMSLASQNWQAVSFVYDNLEGRPSAAVLRYDTGSSQLSVLNPAQVSLVRTSASLESTSVSSLTSANISSNPDLPYLGIGAPRLDENDVFDDRPLHFTNGLELTDDKQALLIVDTSNKRIIKHYIRGDRRGTSDHWAWTPNFPDNIRRGADKRHETYWVVGCGHATDGKMDMFDLLREWPMLRKYILKNVYLFGWLIEQLGAHLLDSTSVRDFGYSLKIGHTFCEKGCSGMMVLQYNKYGDIIRTIHSKEFPKDSVYYSQVSEVIDAINQEHILYLGSPSYNYVTKLTLPTDSFDLPPAAPFIFNNFR